MYSMKQDPYIGKIIEIESGCELGNEYWLINDKLTKREDVKVAIPNILYLCISIKNNRKIYLDEKLIKSEGDNAILRCNAQWERIGNSDDIMLWPYYFVDSCYITYFDTVDGFCYMKYGNTYSSSSVIHEHHPENHPSYITFQSCYHFGV